VPKYASTSLLRHKKWKEEAARQTEHLDHYTGPATITRSIGTRSFVIQYTDGQGTTHTYQRDASTISLVPPTEIKIDPSDADLEEKAPHAHQSITLFLIEEGEYVIPKETNAFPGTVVPGHYRTTVW
jgi:hypothetical protein